MSRVRFFRRTAEEVAQALTAAGFEVISFEEGDQDVDGAVYLSKSIHVQVSEHGSLLSAVREEADGKYTFWPPRPSIGELIVDVVNAKHLHKA